MSISHTRSVKPVIAANHRKYMKKLILSVFTFTSEFIAETHAQQVNALLTELPEAPDKEIELITVNYAPGAVDAIHRHDAHAAVHVLDGVVEMQVREARFGGLVPSRHFTSHLETFIPQGVTRGRRNQRSSLHVLSTMKEHRFSPPFTIFGREH